MIDRRDLLMDDLRSLELALRTLLRTKYKIKGNDTSCLTTSAAGFHVTYGT